jgi:hypothetical protein
MGIGNDGRHAAGNRCPCVLTGSNQTAFDMHMGIDQTRADKPSAKINLFPAAITRTDSGNPIPAEGDITRVNFLG